MHYTEIAIAKPFEGSPKINIADIFGASPNSVSKSSSFARFILKFTMYCLGDNPKNLLKILKRYGWLTPQIFGKACNRNIRMVIASDIAFCVPNISSLIGGGGVFGI